jgi:hypothetical protein
MVYKQDCGEQSCAEDGNQDDNPLLHAREDCTKGGA